MKLPLQVMTTLLSAVKSAFVYLGLSMADITTEITHITIDGTSYGHTEVSAKILAGRDYVLVKIDELEINIELNIALGLCTELAQQFNFGLIDLEAQDKEATSERTI